MTVFPYYGFMDEIEPQEWEQDFQDYCDSLANDFLCQQQGEG